VSLENIERLKVSVMTRELIHPGEFLADELEEIGITPTELSRQIDVPPNRISQIVRGKRDVTADTALRLGRFFGTGPELWMNLQKAYDLDKAKAELGPTIRKIHQWKAQVEVQ
jgi:addiction module HigA family antidote